MHHVLFLPIAINLSVFSHEPFRLVVFRNELHTRSANVVIVSRDPLPLVNLGHCRHCTAYINISGETFDIPHLFRLGCPEECFVWKQIIRNITKMGASICRGNDAEAFMIPDTLGAIF